MSRAYLLDQNGQGLASARSRDRWERGLPPAYEGRGGRRARVVTFDRGRDASIVVDVRIKEAT